MPLCSSLTYSFLLLCCIGGLIPCCIYYQHVTDKLNAPDVPNTLWRNTTFILEPPEAGYFPVAFSNRRRLFIIANSVARPSTSKSSSKSTTSSSAAKPTRFTLNKLPNPGSKVTATNGQTLVLAAYFTSYIAHANPPPPDSQCIGTLHDATYKVNSTYLLPCTYFINTATEQLNITGSYKLADPSQFTLYPAATYISPYDESHLKDQRNGLIAGIVVLTLFATLFASLAIANFTKYYKRQSFFRDHLSLTAT